MAKGTSARPGIPAWKNVSDSAKGTVYGLASAARSTVAGAARSPGGFCSGQGTSGRGSGAVKLAWFGIVTAGRVRASIRSAWPIMPFCASR